MRKWKAHIKFVAEHEAKYQRGEVDIHEMAKGILNSFVARKWVNDVFGAEYNETRNKSMLSEEALDELDEITDELHTIADAKNIFAEDEDIPGVDDYDDWKSSLYDWADEHDVWIEPVSFLEAAN